MNSEVALGLLGKYSSRQNGVRHSSSFAHQPAALQDNREAAKRVVPKK
jgi:hypothetical protein